MAPAPAGEMVLVVGLGNPFMADDGFGPAVIEALRRLGLPSGMAAEVAPDVLHLRSLWRGEPGVWIVDAVERSARPGTIHRLGHEEVLEIPPQFGSAHHLQFGECVRWLLHANPDLRTVRFRLWGAEPATISAHQGLSPRVAAVVGSVAQEIRKSVSERMVNEAEEARVALS